MDINSENIYKLPNGQLVQRIKNPGSYRIIRYVKYSIETDRENHFRELLMLFQPYRNECDLKGGCVTFEERVNQITAAIDEKRKIYEYWRSVIESVEIPEEDDMNPFPFFAEVNQHDATGGDEQETVVDRGEALLQKI